MNRGSELAAVRDLPRLRDALKPICSSLEEEDDLEKVTHHYRPLRSDFSYPLAGYGLYDAGKTFVNTVYECNRSEMSGTDWGLSKRAQ